MKHPKLKSKSNEDGSPRYKTGVHPTYDREYQLRADKSFILNDKKRANNIENSGRLYGADACRYVLHHTLEGKSKKTPGFYEMKGSLFQASIPAAQEQLKNIHQEHKRWAKQQVRKALTLELPKHWPDDLLEKRLKAEAALDVYLAERKKLIELIEKYEANEKKETEEKWLPFGPISTSFNEKAGEIDGQEVDVLSGDVPIPYICDERSPYFKMSVVDYIEMAKQWSAHIKKLGEQEAEKIIQRLEQEVKDGKRQVPPTRMQKMKLRKEAWKDLKISEKDFPKWPKDAKSVDELKKEKTA